MIASERALRLHDDRDDPLADELDRRIKGGDQRE
jgi:hypothetical protein